MTFSAEIKKQIDDYALGHIENESWHISFFDYLGDPALARRLGEEFISTRYIYKILGGLEADNWLLRAQIRMQIISYASIYEAVLHHILFNILANEPAVQCLTEFPTKKQISIPAANLSVLEKYLEHDGKKIIPTYEAIGHTDESKVRFDRKAECACSLGMLEKWLCDDIIEFYEARNAIHIHAEIRKSMTYQIELSMLAYRRMLPFKEQIEKWLQARNAVLLNTP